MNTTPITEADANRHGITLNELDQHCLAAGFSPDTTGLHSLQLGRQWCLDLLANGLPPERLTGALAACWHTAVASADEGIAAMVARIITMATETKEDQ